MDNQQALETLKLVRENSKKRKFSQSVDLIINLRGLNLKRPEENINNFVALPHSGGKEKKVAALVGNELQTKSKGSCELIIHKDNFREYGVDPKKTKKMARGIDYFIAQANLMPDVAKAFGKVLGPLGKMPNPKAGAIIPPAIPSLKPVIEKLKKTVNVKTKNEQVVRAVVGAENMKDEDLVENVMVVYNNIFHAVHEDKYKIKNVILKFSMGRPFVIGRKYSAEELKPVEKKKKQPFKKALAEKGKEKKIEKQIVKEEKKVDEKSKKEDKKTEEKKK